MKLPRDAVIAEAKLTRYLLVRRSRNDKSTWLAKAGYLLANWEILEQNLRAQILTKEATRIHSNQFGRYYRIDACLNSPNGSSLRVRSIWMIEHLSGQAKFVTLYPDQTHE